MASASFARELPPAALVAATFVRIAPEKHCTILWPSVTMPRVLKKHSSDKFCKSMELRNVSLAPRPKSNQGTQGTPS